jgi:Putative MetA-pathway of phenol degradation
MLANSRSPRKNLRALRGRILHGVVLLSTIYVMASARAGELEPRAYANAPVGMNFLIAGYARSEGGLSTDPASPIQDANLNINTGILAYARSLDVWGKSGKFDVIMPFSDLSGAALVSGQPRERNISGLNDPRFRFSVNFIGAPALSMQEFAGYQQDLIVGASIQVSAPLGQYDPSRLVNIGSNRWMIKPDIGLSKALGAFTLELSAGVICFTKNDDYYGGSSLEQDPVYTTQVHVTYNFRNGVWVALDGTYDYGGRTTLNGIQQDDVQEAVPVNRNYSIKFYGSSGVSIRTGSDYNLAGLALQYRW